MALTLDVALAQINAIKGFSKLQQNLNFEDAYNIYLRHPDKATPHTIAEQKFHQAILYWRPEIRYSTNIRHPESGKSLRVFWSP